MMEGFPAQAPPFLGSKGPSEMRVLDLGCGAGLTPEKLGLPGDWEIFGVDAKYKAVAEAHGRFPRRAFVCSVGEDLPFSASSFDCVIANVALPYMDIARSFAEIHRVLVPGGTLLASLHAVRFTLGELWQALPMPKAALYRFFVLANGVIFHFSGRNFGESFQTERGIRIALGRANFFRISFRHDSKRWWVEARKAP
jgi:SAM-dependent methyltransferase